jgi:hypothetical protein
VDASIVIALITGVFLVAGQFVQGVLNRNGAKSVLESDLELQKSLPELSAAKEPLLADIDRRILDGIGAQEKTRYWFGINFGMLLILAGVYFAFLGFTTVEWWRFALFVFALGFIIFGIAGVAVYWPKVERGINGVEIKRAHGQATTTTTSTAEVRQVFPSDTDPAT